MCRSLYPALILLTMTMASSSRGNEPADSQQNDDLVETGENGLPASQNDHLWQPKTRSVAVFKNGLGFFTKTAEVNLHDGWCYAEDIPPAAFGTLAVYSTGADQVVDLVGAGSGELTVFDGHDAAGDVDTKRRKLQASQGLKVTLFYRQRGDQRQVTGTVLSIGDEYAVLEADKQTFAVPLSGISRIELQDLPLRVHVAGEAGEPAEQAELGLAYLRTGILWIPEYTLKLIDERTAELTLRGTLVNEAEDLVNCDVNFVVGVPHFVHSELMSPLAVGRAIRTIGSALPQQGVPQQVMGQMMNRAAIANNFRTNDAFAPGNDEVPAGNELSDLLGNLPQMESVGSGDFTVYTKKNLTVRRGERAMVTLLTQRIAYDHRYRWQTQGEIQHFLTLENNTTTPWTTGPCLALSGDQPLSEDILKYTPVGSRGELQITTAINVAHELTEEEADRELKAHEPRHNEFFDLVTIVGKIRLKSFEKRPVEVWVTTPIQGRPIEASDEGKMQINAANLRLIERSGSIQWQFTLSPGEERTFDYTYERYVPSN